MEIDRRRMLQGLVLAAHGFKNMWMAVADADGHYAAETVEITLAGIVPYILHLAFHNHQRLFVIEKNAGIEELLAQGEDFLCRWTGVGPGFVVGWRKSRTGYAR